MASRYSLQAEMPPTRKSLHRSRRILTDQADTDGQAIPPSDGEKIQLHSLQQQHQVAAKGASVAADGSPVDLNDGPDPRGYKTLQGKARWGLTPDAFLDDDINDEGRRTRSNRVPYLEGLRGILGLQTLVWIFFRMFAPAIVTEFDVDGTQPARFIAQSPQWMNILRKVLSPVLFDGNLQMAMFIILSGRTVLHTFIERRKALALSGPAFRRPFRLLLPVAATLTIVSIVNVAGGFTNATRMADDLQNELARPQPIWDSALEFFNSLVVYFFSPVTYRDSRAATFIPPAGILWFVTVVFQQLYVLIILAWVLPYTLLKYKNLGLPLFIITTAWVGRWSWYTITGLAIAEYSVAYLPLLPAAGIPLDRAGRRHVPTWLPALVFTLAGLLMKYLWTAALPGSYANDYIVHANTNTGKLNYGFEGFHIAMPRWDDWLLATGLFVLVETTPALQRLLASKPVSYCGRWSFSIALLSGTVMQSLGSTLYVHLRDSQGWQRNGAATLAALFFTMVPTCLVVAEAFSRIVDDAALWLARFMFNFIRE
ncbi:uncharacterized protein PFL1_05665 [Pseudozyma flocculosa PF-1]|uniref:Acyltransferase 3 domain-containing protein n=2 Tax=Pseudozyma flocculosa TaxID=84751 RepID=A0A5C3FA69_9BASI|nr:uncharacterized protein PFL1_05665 [Pseudozyma flocculosa PF-1]EPQ26686.1 hypothetical protein PFL1_05665 [Pseudozyma flocculosa PF-1]SPO40996.1 uncharacterized protein PSFLO_06478 [Pseudozyma flocculosa]